LKQPWFSNAKKGKRPERDSREIFAVRSMNSAAATSRPSKGKQTSRTHTGTMTGNAGPSRVTRSSKYVGPLSAASLRLCTDCNIFRVSKGKAKAHIPNANESNSQPHDNGPTVPGQQNVWSSWMPWTYPKAQVEKEHILEAIRKWNENRDI